MNLKSIERQDQRLLVNSISREYYSYNNSVKAHIQQKIRITLVILVSIVILGIICYPIPYRFFVQTISDLGGYYSYTYSVEIQPIRNDKNTVSMVFFSIGFLIVGVFSLNVSQIYKQHENIEANKLKSILCLVMSMGAFGISVPWDLAGETSVWHWIHSAGTIFFVLGFISYNFLCQRISRKNFQLQSKTKSPLDLQSFFCKLLSIILIANCLWYFISALIGALNIDRSGLQFFSTGLAQKFIFFIGILNLFLFRKKNF